MIKIAVVVGSIRADSLNHKLAKDLERLLPAEAEFDYVDIATLPLFSQDLEADFPAAGGGKAGFGFRVAAHVISTAGFPPPATLETETQTSGSRKKPPFACPPRRAQNRPCDRTN